MRNIQILGTLILCLSGLMFMGTTGYSQTESNPNSLEVIVDDSSNAYFTVNFEKGSTLYSICKKYHVATIDAMMLNDISNPEQISIGQELVLPLNKDFFKVSNKYVEDYTPVYYKTKKSETLFRISKVYFSQDVKDMIERNDLSGFTLSIDQRLLVGYYKLDGATSTIKQEEKVLVQREASKITVPTPTEQAVKVKDLSIAESNETVEKNEEAPIQISTDIEESTKPTTPEQVITKVEPSLPTHSEQVITEAETPDQIKSVPTVARYRFRPNAKARFKKVIKSDKLDHSIAERKSQEEEEMIDYSTETAEEERPETSTEATEEESLETSTEITEEEIAAKPETNLVSKSVKGIAYWDKKGKDYENLMVLHKTAEVNTLIKLTNPINGMSTFARVVGKIPDNAFKKDIDVVLSPAVARKIGAIDSRMQIAMTYQINKP